MRIFSPVLGKKGSEHMTLFASVVFQVPLAPYAKVAYFGVADSVVLHL